MIFIIVCLCQLTLIALLALGAASWCLSRAPQLAARLCWLGIALSSLVAVVTYVGAPRPLVLSSLPEAIASDSSQGSSAKSQARELLQEPKTKNLTQPRSGLSLNALLQGFSKFRSRYAEVESRFAGGLTITATAFCGIVLIRCLLGGLWLWRLRRSREIGDDSPVYCELRELVLASKMRKMFRLRQNDALSSPCVGWLSRGTIYIPAGFERWTPEERSAALAHELAHELRFDAQWRFAAELCLSCVCFHPLMHFLRKQLIFAQELATDQRAAELLGSRAQYRRGLTLLALRMDSQRTASCLVSVSTNDVVRRIRMLNVTKPSLRRWQELSVVVAIALMSTFVAAWTAQADDTLRVASRKKVAAAESATPAAAKPLSPWEELGEQDGYLVLRPTQLIRHPLFASLYRNIVEPELNDLDLSETGLSLENVLSVQLPLMVQLSKLSEEEAQNGNRHQLNASCDGIVLETSRPVAWKKIAEQLPELLGQYDATKWYSGSEAGDWLEGQLSAYDQKSVLRLISTQAENRTVNKSEKLQSVWLQACTNGDLAAAFITPEGILSELEDEADLVAARALFESIDASAVALSLRTARDMTQIQLVFAPVDGCSGANLAKLVETTRGKVVEVGMAAAGALALGGAAGQAKLQVHNQLLDELAAGSIEVVTGHDGNELVVVQVATEADLTALLK